MRALLIPSNTETAPTVIDIDPGLKAIQDAVGGYIQMIGIRDHDINAYLCEEGKLLGMPFNPRATAIALSTSSIFPTDVIVGDILFVGPCDEEGYDTDLPQHEASWLQQHCNADHATAANG
ncbi:DUF3846 domain-containing protein [Arthrobacter sp. A2-55]|uniref:DUF3846 domain-containing protein n=1 Tax=Arthrobacter sp. A2-55 TaxID=2897337 RepID=UPI0021CD5922|nr:DUF3846 domain-containing protein [Arthrobacter sp. A2-55]MCU6481931.1 DUF3846 domain-containing protein [Arthrobacter sp. A2-55]